MEKISINARSASEVARPLLHSCIEKRSKPLRNGFVKNVPLFPFCFKKVSAFSCCSILFFSFPIFASSQSPERLATVKVASAQGRDDGRARCATIFHNNSRARAIHYACVRVNFMCINPVSAWFVGTTPDGKKKLSFKPSEFAFSECPHFALPCGKCIGCQNDRRNRWVSRLMLEHFCHDSKGAFVTLTYADAPSCLSKSDVQKFLKRFRNIPRDYKIPLPDFTYFFCGEYGSRKGRPHYHGLFFGVDPFVSDWKTDIVLFKDGHPIFSSALLSDVWGKGFVTVDELTSANIRYVTKYLLKRYCSKGDEFTLKSIGLGSDFFFNFGDTRSDVSVGKYYDMYERGLIHLPSNRGKMSSVPIPSQSFDRYVQLLSPSDLESLKLSRKQFRVNHPINPQAIRERSAWLQVTLADKPNERILHDN